MCDMFVSKQAGLFYTACPVSLQLKSERVKEIKVDNENKIKLLYIEHYFSKPL